MLRRVVFENFVHFEGRQVLDFAEFQNEPIFFVGASSTGKSAALELIRRCLDSTRNASLTARNSPDSMAYVFCEFSIEHEDYEPIVITGVLVDSKRKENNEAEPYNDEKDTKFHKIIIYCCKGENKIEVCYETLLENSLTKGIEPFRSIVKLPSCLHGTLDGMIKQDDFAEKKLSDILSQIRTDLRRPNSEKTNLTLLEDISQIFVGTFPMRGLGVVQWTDSERILGQNRQENYQSLCKQAEIITKLLDSPLIKKYKAERIFRYLTDGKDIKFEKVGDGDGDGDGSINVFHDKKKFPLLKASVGVLEAEQFSLLMAHKDKKTICLEEPDRGMHPQMIHCMNVVLQEESRKKRIIVVTHSPYLVDSPWYKNIFFFNGKDISNSIPIPSGKSTIPEKDDFATLLFSSRILLVEGKTDKIVLQGLFRNLFTMSTPECECKPECECTSECLPKCTTEVVERNENILRYQIFSCGGKEAIGPVKKICDKMNIKCLEVLDRDAVIEIDNRGLIEKIDEEGFDFFTEKPISEFLEKEFVFENDTWRCIEKNEDKISSPTNKMKRQPFEELSKLLAKKGKFIWKSGDLEDVLSVKKCRQNVGKALDIKRDKMETRKKFKRAVKDTLSAGLSKEQLEELTASIMHFEDFDRLLKFLGD